MSESSRILTLVFTDLVDSTALKTQHGDHAVGPGAGGVLDRVREGEGRADVHVPRLLGVRDVNVLRGARGRAGGHGGGGRGRRGGRGRGGVGQWHELAGVQGAAAAEGQRQVQRAVGRVVVPPEVGPGDLIAVVDLRRWWLVSVAMGDASE